MNNKDQVEIAAYNSKYQKSFKDLNIEWISNYFEVEPNDIKALDHAEEYIINKGGEIFSAVLNDEVLGVCALIKSDGKNYDYELAKMAVSPKTQGKGVGLLLAESAIKWASEKGASKIYLESNTKLTPAIKLYEKLGFKRITGISSAYNRVDIQMLLTLNS
ncbi:GNAT family N-acetyltransferase [Flavobacterium johnsoniae]|uniref:GCN5-related N-acetyltransferase n=1 Tax=Flavobacterium johnsoniae (strain ATCC 17061 / DSM 2064 / JCM 8514 / BCRC 14874 / CCUG 350202 / NBRC 14942 / NCIMB 11054 / UW101) TaxID=376686 RepID=A5FNM8_FLAJ1|nr:GNAT family N-acetyltransferase [Flavobacterium johnsoniae]ABQ03184.1 GCN5-related N-acetyltransferase [Flavobacterium johnsoniae UW101]OXG01388.1 MarR family transcriptional regulator [Flavobacterium johnsoniae UW101]WQG79955.1 GNAT family N-acetyltransferase [Flavobacterium johnsoniae UW101]SHL82783.1 Ribosomal protein S18 acetylase RimI [Flavobacterium johnsoniae]